MKNSITQLSEEEIGLLKRLLLDSVATFKNPFKSVSSPFIQLDGNELIVERNGDLTDNYEGIFRTLKREQSDLYLLKLSFTADIEIHDIIEGYQIFRGIDKDSFWEEGFKIGYNVQGIPFYVFSSSLTWCIYINFDTRFITGDSLFFSSYYISEEEKKNEIMIFLNEFFDKTFGLESPRHVCELIKFKIDDTWVENTRDWFSKHC